LLGLDDLPIDDAQPSKDANCPTYFADRDHDGHGDLNAPIISCARPDSVSDTNDDCDDTNRYRSPELVEVCDGIDNDCDGQIDDNGCATGCTSLRRPPPDDATAYILCLNQVPFMAARTACGSWGFHLAYIETPAENAFVMNQIGGKDVWLGGSDQLSDGRWIWGNGVVFSNAGTTVTYAAWAPTQPDGQNFEDCLDVSTNGWSDHPCGTSDAYLCER